MAQFKAQVGDLQRHLSRVGQGLDDYLKFEHADALVNRDEWMAQLSEPLPAKGCGLDAVSRQLLEVVIPNGSVVPKPGFNSYITTGATNASVMATTAAGIASPQKYGLTTFNYLEELSLQWMAQMFGLNDMRGVYSSGGSVANLVALGGARQYAFEKLGLDPARDGVDRPVSVYASDECHHTIQRSGGVLGIGRRAIKAIACDEQGRMKIDTLKEAMKRDLEQGILPMAMVANAGTTNAGAIDPIQQMGELAREHDIWFHVDGAYGLPGILDDRVSHLYQGLEMADSVIVDPHKWLGASVGIAATFVRNIELLERAFTQEPADYLEGNVESDAQNNPVIEHSMDSFGIPYFDYGVELSSPCRGVAVWAMIKEIGVEGMTQRIRFHNDLAKHIAHFADRHPKLETVLAPTLSVCCFRYVTSVTPDLDKFNQMLHKRLVRGNQFLPSTTRINDKLVLRPCIINARTERQTIDGMLESVIRIGESLEKELSVTA